MTIKSSCTALLLGSLLLPAIFVPGAFAQNQTPVTNQDAAPKPKPMGPNSMGPHSMGPKAMGPKAMGPKAMEQNAASMTERVEQHITQLHAQLLITPAQQAQWDQFAQVMRDNAKDIGKAFEQRRGAFDSMNAADNMQSYAQIAQEHAQNTQKLATAFQVLYGAMTNDQKKNADAVFHAHNEPLHGGPHGHMKKN